MHFTKEVQYGMLLALYLSRAGRAKAEDVAANLGLSVAFIQKVAGKLKRVGVITSFMGPGGGYELRTGVTVRNVITCFESVNFLTPQEHLILGSGETEERAFSNYGKNLDNALSKLLNRTISSVAREQSANEKAVMDKLDIKGLEN